MGGAIGAGGDWWASIALHCLGAGIVLSAVISLFCLATLFVSGTNVPPSSATMPLEASLSTSPAADATESFEIRWPNTELTVFCGLLLSVGFAASLVAGAQRFRLQKKEAMANVAAWTEIAAAWPSSVMQQDFNAAIEHLPEPVQVYLESVVSEKRRHGAWKIIRAVTRHNGHIAGASAAAEIPPHPFEAETTACALRPAFAWRARVGVGIGRWVDGLHTYAPCRGGNGDSENGGFISGFKGYKGGAGGFKGYIGGSTYGFTADQDSVGGYGGVFWRLWSVVRVHDAKSSASREALLLRWLVEAPWYPTALCSRRCVHWEAVDRHTALATVTDGVTRASALFSFSADCSRVVAVSGIGERAWIHDPTRPGTSWTVELSSYADMDGYLIPTVVVIRRPAGFQKKVHHGGGGGGGGRQGSRPFSYSGRCANSPPARTPDLVSVFFTQL